MSNTPFIIGLPHDLDVLLTPSHGAIFRCLAVHLVCSCRVVTIVYPMFAQHSLARVSTLSSRYCTTILSALQLYIMTCRRLRLALALQQLSSSTTISLIPLHPSCPRRLLAVSKNTKKNKIIHDQTRRACLHPGPSLNFPTQSQHCPSIPRLRADFSFVGSSSIRQKADRHHPSLFRAFFSISEDVSPFAPHLSPLTPSLVTLARQRGLCCTPVHVNVKWSDVLFFPGTARAPNTTTTVLHRRLSPPHLTSLQSLIESEYCV
ncbi:hypothetical protein EDB85DRAFT_844262 [Lactarius pseudohatsudake]|nr:hypothetical protein EDB85DRAFT_844262 [Lactarius pseudohatsudake]